MDTWLSSERHFLNLDWGLIAKRGVPSLPIVKEFDILKDLGSALLKRVVVPSMNQLHLERVKETFGYRKIPTIPLPTHTALAAPGCQ